MRRYGSSVVQVGEDGPVEDVGRRFEFPLQRPLQVDVAGLGAAVPPDQSRGAAGEDAAKPRQKGGFGAALEAVEEAVRVEERLLHEVGRVGLPP